MNLLKKAHANFVRYGASLESKFDKALDHHYLAFNMGVPASETSLSLKVFLRGEEPMVFETIMKGVPITKEFIGVILRFESPNLQEAKAELDQLITIIKEQGSKVMPELESLLPFVTFYTGIDDKNVVLAAEVNHPFFEEIVEKFKNSFLEKVGEDFQMQLNVEFGLKNSFKKMMEDLSQKFVAFFFEGFIAEMKLSVNSTLLKTVRQAGLQFLLEKGAENLKNWAVLLSLIQGSKFHMVFRELEDVNVFFKGMGVDSLLDAQPSTKNILDEIKTDLKSPERKKDGIMMGLVNFCQKHVIAQGSFSLKLPQSIATVAFHANGVKELVNYMLSD